MEPLDRFFGVSENRSTVRREIGGGVTAGCVSFVAIKLVTGRWREVHPVMLVIALALVARYALLP